LAIGQKEQEIKARISIKALLALALLAGFVFLGAVAPEERSDNELPLGWDPGETHS